MKLVDYTWLIVVLVTILYQVKAEEEKGEKKKKLQIGVKKRVDPEQCKIKSRKGDTLNMHYTVSLRARLLYIVLSSNILANERISHLCHLSSALVFSSCCKFNVDIYFQFGAIVTGETFYLLDSITHRSEKLDL